VYPEPRRAAAFEVYGRATVKSLAKAKPQCHVERLRETSLRANFLCEMATVRNPTSESAGPGAPSLRVWCMQGWVLGLASKNCIHGTASLGGEGF
jgi:hypothetical protein